MHRDGCFCVLGRRFALPQGVAGSLWPAVAEAANSTKDVAASLPLTVAAAANPALPTLRRHSVSAVARRQQILHLSARQPLMYQLFEMWGKWLLVLVSESKTLSLGGWSAHFSGDMGDDLLEEYSTIPA